MNIATLVMEKQAEILKATSQKYKEYATEPYGVKKSTPKEQMDMYNNLTEGDLYGMIEKYGMEDVNKWLYRMEQRSK